jgi:hypothetical protein
MRQTTRLGGRCQEDQATADAESHVEERVLQASPATRTTVLV